jgi:MFS family permease
MDFGTPIHDIFLIPALWQSLWNSLVQLGIIAGAVINGPFQDRFGRKWAFRMGAMIGAVGGVLRLSIKGPITNVHSQELLFFTFPIFPRALETVE